MHILFSSVGTGAAPGTTGSDLADFLIGIPDTSNLNFGTPSKYFRSSVYDAYINDKFHMLSNFTIDAGLRWEHGSPMSEPFGHMVNLDIAPGFTAAAPVLASDPFGPITGTRYPASLVRPDYGGWELRIGIAWRPFLASSTVVRAGYGIYDDTSVYLSSAEHMAEQAPLATGISVANSSTCPLTLAHGFRNCTGTAADTYAIAPNFQVGHAQDWKLSLQTDLPGALVLTVTYLGIKGTHGVQEFLPNTYPPGEANPYPGTPVGFAYRTSGGNSTHESGAAAQKIGTNATSGQAGVFQFKVNSQLVVETVVVQDKKGNFVPNLTARDFRVTEDRVPQTIRVFRHQSLSNTSTPLPATPQNDAQIVLYKRLVSMQIIPENPNDSQYNEHRLLVLYFDMTAMPYADQQRALAAAKKFIRTRMAASDLAAIMWYTGGAIQVVQNFTANRNRLLSTLETMIVGQGQGSVESVNDASSADTEVAFGQDDSEFNLFNNNRQLAALQTAVRMLGGIKEKKALIYFAGGMHLSGLDNLAQIHATIDAAIRAGVSFWPIDARGLVAEAPLGDATHGSPGNIGVYSGAAARAVTRDFQQSQDTLYTLGADTGGKALFDNNDLTQGIVRAQHAIGNYYIIGCYTTNTAQNGHYRRIKIKVSSPLAQKVEYRRGYYAGKTFKHFTKANKERQLEDAMILGDSITQLTIAMEVDYFQLNRAQYFVPVTVDIPGSELALAKRFGADHTVIDFLCEIMDAATGITVSNLRDHINIKLSDETAAQLARRRIEYDSGFTLFPGRYLIKFLARDDETGRIGTFKTYFAIPNLNVVKKRVAISAVILSSQRVDLGSALHNAVHGKKMAKENAANPLVQNGSKLIPSVPRVFHRGHDLYIYLQAYDKDPAPSPGAIQPSASTVNQPKPYFVYVSLYRHRKLALETAPIAVTAKSGTRLGVIPINFQIGLGTFALGKYRCVVTALDPTGILAGPLYAREISAALLHAGQNLRALAQVFRAVNERLVPVFPPFLNGFAVGTIVPRPQTIQGDG